MDGCDVSEVHSGFTLYWVNTAENFKDKIGYWQLKTIFNEQ